MELARLGVFENRLVALGDYRLWQIVFLFVVLSLRPAKRKTTPNRERVGSDILRLYDIQSRGRGYIFPGKGRRGVAAGSGGGGQGGVVGDGGSGVEEVGGGSV